MPTVDFTLQDIEAMIDRKLDEKFDQKLGTALTSEREHTKNLLLTEREHTQSLFAAEREYTKGLFVAEREYTKSLFETEREHTRGMIEKSAEDVKDAIRGEFLDFWETNLEPAFEGLYGRIEGVEQGLKEVKHEVQGVGRLTARHSQDIMDLRARR